MVTKAKTMVEFGDYIFIEEEKDVVSRAELFKTLPVKYEHLKKTHKILGRGDKLGVLVGGNMDSRLVIVLEKKRKITLVAGVLASDCSSLRRSVQRHSFNLTFHIKPNQDVKIRRKRINWPRQQ